MAEGMSNPFGELTHNTLLEQRKTNNVKQVAGFEPVTSAWEANMLPLHHTCITTNYFLHSYLELDNFMF